MKRNHAKVFALLTLVAALACATLAPAANADAAITTTSNETVPIDFIATSCSGETVIISGESHVLVHTTSNDNHTTFETHIQFNLSGEGASGTRYVADETVDSITNGGVGAQTFTSVGQLNLVSQGSADNLVVRTTIHVTVNANGEITSTSFEFTTECRG